MDLWREPKAPLGVVSRSRVVDKPNSQTHQLAAAGIESGQRDKIPPGEGSGACGVRNARGGPANRHELPRADRIIEMGANTVIAWTDATWNPWQGCHKISLGCENCYMFREKIQYGQEPDIVVRSKPPTFNLPLRLKKPMRVFTCSWSDFFIREADAWRDEAWAIIDRTRHLTYQILTKRIERVAARLPWGAGEPWSHVQIVVSVENQEQADRRIPKLLAVNATIRGVSYEPALGPVTFEQSWMEHYGNGPPGNNIDRGLDWLVVGGESGPGYRSMNLADLESVDAQTRAAGVPLFVKQDSGPKPGRQGRIPDRIWARKEFPATKISV